MTEIKVETHKIVREISTIQLENEYYFFFGRRSYKVEVVEYKKNNTHNAKFINFIQVCSDSLIGMSINTYQTGIHGFGKDTGPKWVSEVTRHIIEHPNSDTRTKEEFKRDYSAALEYINEISNVHTK